MTKKKDKKPAENTARKQRGRPFQKGKSGNPSGRPKGSKNHSSIIGQKLIDENCKDIIESVIESAVNGDMTAARILVDRLIPPRRDKPINIELPEIKNSNDVVTALGIVIKKIGEGDLTLTEGQSLAAILTTKLETITIADFEKRLKEIEGGIKK